MVTATLVGVACADALGHPVINLMFLIPIGHFKGVFVEEDVMVILKSLVELPFFSVFDLMNSTMCESWPLDRHY